MDFGKNISFSGALILQENWLKHGILYVIQRNPSILGKNARSTEKAPLCGMCHVAHYRKEGILHSLKKMPDDRKEGTFKKNLVWMLYHLVFFGGTK